MVFIDPRLQAHLQALFDQVEDAIFLKNAEGKYVLCNKAAARTIGRQRGEVLDHSDAELFDADAAEEMRAIDLEILRTGASFTYERSRKVRGSTRLLHTTKSRYIDAETGTPYIIGISRDITEKARIDRHLAANKHLSSVSAITASMVHEINNPLTYVLGNLQDLGESLERWRSALEQLEDSGSSGEVLERLRAGGVDIEAMATALERVSEVQTATQRIAHVAQGLSDLTASGEEKAALLRFGDVVASAVEMVAATVRYRARLEYRLGPNPLIRGQTQRLRQMLATLLVALAHAMPERGVAHNYIAVGIEVLDGYVHLSIEHSLTLQPYDESVANLVVSLMRLVLDVHEGSVKYREDDEQRVIQILFPEAAPEPAAPALTAKAPANEAQADDAPANEAQTDDARVAHAPAKERARVLLIDDEPLVRALLKRMLSKRHDTQQADSGAAAIELLKEDAAFDAILCDVMMPEMTGVDVYTWLQEHHPELVPRLAFVTAGAYSKRGRDLLAWTTRPVLAKPFDRQGLERTLQSLLDA
ncbi:response regulator [Haliangium ochraceum]|uniref:histidine kinase n=1 Tax=Haliangium ochraceum (strain DSM 14365 / JCM 11303 / SMP-2) TaxID=502025 RepID=D0LL93_HALO1|nr:response regulator [Haliangium ochraceum]ACY18589.1 putative PAS/PAC sensor protein [Haliangium ochraceum DSM 14365]